MLMRVRGGQETCSYFHTIYVYIADSSYLNGGMSNWMACESIGSLIAKFLLVLCTYGYIEKALSFSRFILRLEACVGLVALQLL